MFPLAFPFPSRLMYAHLQRNDLEWCTHERCAHHSRHSISLLPPWLPPTCYLCGSKSTKGISFSTEPVHNLAYWGFIECQVWFGDMSQEDVRYCLNHRRRRFFTTGMWCQEFCWLGEKHVEEKNLWTSTSPALVSFKDWQFPVYHWKYMCLSRAPQSAEANHLCCFCALKGQLSITGSTFFLWKHREIQALNPQRVPPENNFPRDYWLWTEAFCLQYSPSLTDLCVLCIFKAMYSNFHIFAVSAFP